MSVKKIIITLVSLVVSQAAIAQQGGSGVQPTSLGLADVVGVTVFGDGGTGGTGGGGTVELPMGGVNGMANGIESPEIKVKLQTTTGFDISISASSSVFSYTGPSTFGTTMNVEDVLTIMVTENGTGGAVGSGFEQYQPIDGTNSKSLISAGQPGERTFAFKYKATPGFEYPAGTYTTDIVYTIAQR